MKKTVILFFVITLSFGAVAFANAPNRCNTEMPGWGGSLGTVTFDTRGHNVEIHGTGVNAHIHQVWSGAVTATACQKETFWGGTIREGLTADCRTNPGFPGDLFSWCAVARFADQLCPYPWRVPTMQDFVDLDIALDGSGMNRFATPQFTATEHLVTRWGGARGGYSNWFGVLNGQGNLGHYWSQDAAPRSAYLFFFGPSRIAPQGTMYKGAGLALRCIQTAEMPMFAQDFAPAISLDDIPEIPDYLLDFFLTPPDEIVEVVEIVEVTEVIEISYDILVTGVLIDISTARLVAGETITLTATIFPENATNTDVFWTSSNTNVATMDGSGMVMMAGSDAVTVTALSRGIATITVTTVDGDHTDYFVLHVTEPVPMTGCNLNTPEWGESLGTVGFYTDTEWLIEGNYITQIWSDAVTATACQKTTFAGGSTEDFNADCRSNTGFNGDLFSWCAVVRFADELCPYPWRVPTAQDFVDLDIALGGTGMSRTDGTATPQFVTDNFITRWGGAFGTSDADTPDDQGTWGIYWSQAEISTDIALGLGFSTNGHVWTNGSRSKGNSFMLRCVR